jgi:hypothetical protein
LKKETFKSKLEWPKGPVDTQKEAYRAIDSHEYTRTKGSKRDQASNYTGLTAQSKQNKKKPRAIDLKKKQQYRK